MKCSVVNACSRSRIVAPAVLVSLLISLIVFIIIDLDRPKRGLIQVNQSVLHELKQSEVKTGLSE